MSKDKYGIYGIYKDNELIYIGMTIRSFRERWYEHKNYIKNNSEALYLYFLIDSNDNIEFRIIVDADKLIDNSEKNLKRIEEAMINDYKPVGNIIKNRGGRPRKVDIEELKRLKNEGYTNKQIAKKMNCSVSAIEKNWRYYNGK